MRSGRGRKTGPGDVPPPDRRPLVGERSGLGQRCGAWRLARRRDRERAGGGAVARGQQPLGSPCGRGGEPGRVEGARRGGKRSLRRVSGRHRGAAGADRAARGRERRARGRAAVRAAETGAAPRARPPRNRPVRVPVGQLPGVVRHGRGNGRGDLRQPGTDRGGGADGVSDAVGPDPLAGRASRGQPGRAAAGVRDGRGAARVLRARGGGGLHGPGGGRGSPGDDDAR